MKHGLVVLTLAALPLLAQAQTIWRCGPDGRSFSDTPCAEGQALAVADTRPSQDVAAARAQADREMRLAEKLRRERLREESAQRGNGLAALGPVTGSVDVRASRRELRQLPRAKPAAHRPAPSAGETFRATAPASRRGQG
jgi:Domain of unknown function (DUF4124)